MQVSPDFNDRSRGSSQNATQLIDALMDFVIGVYRERRDHWPPELIAKLRQTAIDYRDVSTYMDVTDDDAWDSWGSPHILGTLRFIREKNGLLPLEHYLGIRVERLGDIKVEPGNLAISKHVSQDVWPELVLQMTSSAVGNVERNKKNHYITFADLYSKPLYASLGFRPVPAERLTFLPGVEVIPFTEVIDGVEHHFVKIKKDGIEWTPMEALQEDLNNLLDVHIGRIERRGHHPDEARALRSRRANLDNTTKRPMLLSRETIYKGERWRGRISFDQKPGGWIMIGLYTEKYALYKWRNMQIRSIGMVRESDLPLRDGYQVAPSDEYPPLFYSNGQLIFRPSKGTQVIMSAPADLSVINRVSIVSEGPAVGRSRLDLSELGGFTLNF